MRSRSWNGVRAWRTALLALPAIAVTLLLLSSVATAENCEFFAFKVDPETGSRLEDPSRENLVSAPPMHLRFIPSGGVTGGRVDYWYSVDGADWVHYGFARGGNSVTGGPVVTIEEPGSHSIRFACVEDSGAQWFSDPQTALVEGGGSGGALTAGILILVLGAILVRRSQAKERERRSSKLRVIFDGLAVRVFERTKAGEGQSERELASYRAVSGQPGTGPDDQCEKDFGPLPEGRYTFFSREFAEPPPAERDAWGRRRVPLHPAPETYLCEPRRGGFYIHGGADPESHGCIDLTSNDIAFHQLVMKEKGPIEVLVDYEAWRRERRHSAR